MISSKSPWEIYLLKPPQRRVNGEKNHIHHFGSTTDLQYVLKRKGQESFLALCMGNIKNGITKGKRRGFGHKMKDVTFIVQQYSDKRDCMAFILPQSKSHDFIFNLNFKVDSQRPFSFPWGHVQAWLVANQQTTQSDEA